MIEHLLWVTSLAETEAIAAQLAEQMPREQPAVLLLYGDLGSGKTAFVQALGNALGITEPITSPTFALIQEYPDGCIPLYHVDLYRLEPEQVPALHLELYWQGGEILPGVVAIEWAERLTALPPEFLKVELSVMGDRRCLCFSSGAPRWHHLHLTPPDPANGGP
ncbi:MAG: tRNA (adenosine(37)-N6)-threonylcarbamoyltransferase complex ATPase subunit type 1 TsaE [Oscillatoriales cyanobacterium SM2_2_1]|nr:tRNA (adenosine(37)-N6)-threonylcarbamoyltransferase complex ATPase subunit type 1 TsaE [Oscillatoriales cyanobacterium SM2_2_1]